MILFGLTVDCSYINPASISSLFISGIHGFIVLVEGFRNCELLSHVSFSLLSFISFLSLG